MCEVEDDDENRLWLGECCIIDSECTSRRVDAHHDNISASHFLYFRYRRWTMAALVVEVRGRVRTSLERLNHFLDEVIYRNS